MSACEVVPLHVCKYIPSMPGVHRGQGRAMDLLELFWMAVKSHMGSRFGKWSLS